jgi:WD40 repeat protein
VRLLPDGKTLAVGDGPAVALWEVGSGHSRGRLEGGPGLVLGMAFSPDGRFLATGRTAGASPQLWHLASGRVVGQIDGRAINRVESLAFSPDGKLLAAGGGDNTVLVCEVAGLLAEKPLQALPR